MRRAILPIVFGRIGGLFLTLTLSSIVIFSALIFTPGDPIAALAGGARPTPELVAQIRDEYHLDDPIWSRYLRWLGGVLSGDFGRSFVYHTDVISLIAPRFAVTLQLVAITVCMIVCVGVGSGILAATRGAAVDRTVTALTALGMSLPTFIVAIILIWVFSQLLNWFPVFGAGSGGWDRIWHLVLPAISLATMYLAYVSRITRAALVAGLHAEHVDTARVRGIPGARIFRVHVFQNASPQILAISGTTIASLFAASAVAEQAFGIGGIGSLLTEAAARGDLPVVQIVSLLLVTVFVVLNALADIVATVIDPDSIASGWRQ